MRAREVRRASAAIAVLCALACAVDAWIVAGASPRGARAAEATALDPRAGERVFERRCARCHSVSEAAEFLRARGSSAAAALELAAFLPEHGRIDDSAARAVVLFLAQAPAAR